MSFWSTLFKKDLTGSSARRVELDTTQRVPVYQLDNAKTINVELLRQIFHNRNNHYALGGQLVKPIINSNVSFIAEPQVVSENKQTEEFLSKLPFSWAEVHTLAEREGTVFVWPQWDNLNKKIHYEIIPIDKVWNVSIDPVTKEPTAYFIREQLQFVNQAGVNQIVSIDVKITKEFVTKFFVGDTGQISQVTPNPFGFIPVVQFDNNREPQEMRGHSEIENVEPQIKFYHDVTLEAAQGQKRDGHPKLKVTGLNNVKSWIDNNFGAGTFDNIQAGTAKVKLSDKDLYVCGPGEDVGYLSSAQVTGDYGKLAENAFTNIVEGAETPELIFGANLGTSLASVREQRPVWIRKIKRKQNQYDASWRKLIDYSIAIYNFATVQNILPEYNLIWPEPDFKDEKEGAEILALTVQTLANLKNNFMISDEEIFETLRRFENLEFNRNYEEHKKQVDETARSLAERSLDNNTQNILDENGMV